MLLKLYRKLAHAAYQKYAPQRAAKAKKAIDYKKDHGFNDSYASGTLSVSALHEGFQNAGLLSTDTIFIRTSLAAANAFEGGVPAYLKALMEYFKDGNIMMSSYTFNKSPVMYLADNPLFDPAKSMDQLNLVSEFFRRQPDTYRSIHPTHSVVAWGKDARWLTADHHKSSFCYAPDSPFARLFELGAKEISVGVYPTSITFHYVEQFMGAEVPCFQDMETPIISRVVVDGKEEQLPFRETDSFAVYDAFYDVFEGTPAEPIKHFFAGEVDFYTMDLCDRLQAMKDLAAAGKHWHTEPSKAKNFVLKNIVKPLVLAAFYEKKDGELHPVARRDEL